MQISELRKRLKRSTLDSSDILPLAFVGLAIGEMLLAIGLIWIGHSINQIAQKPAPTLVQKVDGQAFTVRSTDHDYREPQVIRQLVQEWAALTYTWSGKVTTTIAGKAQSPTKDEGIKVKNKRVPTVAWQASFLLSSDSESSFREAFLEELTKMPHLEGVLAGNTKTVLVVQHVSEPQALAGTTGRWQVNLVANLIVVDRNHPAGITIPWNHAYFVRAVEPPQTPLPDPASDYQQVIYQLRQRGLEIEKILPFEGEKP